MGLLSDIFGSGSKTSTSKTYTSTKTQDQRIGVEGGFAGQLVAPGGTLASPGSVATSVGDFSNLTQTVTGNKFKVGMSGAEVAELLKANNLGFATASSAAADTNAKLANLATTALTAQTGVPADWQRYIVPVGVILVALAWVKKGG